MPSPASRIPFPAGLRPVRAGPRHRNVNANRSGGLPPTPSSCGRFAFAGQPGRDRRRLVRPGHRLDAGALSRDIERSTAPSFDNPLMHYVAISKARLVHKPI
jgi:hypothetical protein